MQRYKIGYGGWYGDTAIPIIMHEDEGGGLGGYLSVDEAKRIVTALNQHMLAQETLVAMDTPKIHTEDEIRQVVRDEIVRVFVSARKL